MGCLRWVGDDQPLPGNMHDIPLLHWPWRVVPFVDQTTIFVSSGPLGPMVTALSYWSQQSWVREALGFWVHLLPVVTNCHAFLTTDASVRTAPATSVCHRPQDWYTLEDRTFDGTWVWRRNRDKGGRCSILFRFDFLQFWQFGTPHHSARDQWAEKQ